MLDVPSHGRRGARHFDQCEVRPIELKLDVDGTDEIVFLADISPRVPDTASARLALRPGPNEAETPARFRPGLFFQVGQELRDAVELNGKTLARLVAKRDDLVRALGEAGGSLRLTGAFVRHVAGAVSARPVPFTVVVEARRSRPPRPRVALLQANGIDLARIGSSATPIELAVLRVDDPTTGVPFSGERALLRVRAEGLDEPLPLLARRAVRAGQVTAHWKEAARPVTIARWPEDPAGPPGPIEIELAIEPHALEEWVQRSGVFSERQRLGLAAEIDVALGDASLGSAERIEIGAEVHGRIPEALVVARDGRAMRVPIGESATSPHLAFPELRIIRRADASGRHGTDLPTHLSFDVTLETRGAVDVAIEASLQDSAGRRASQPLSTRTGPYFRVDLPFAALAGELIDRGGRIEETTCRLALTLSRDGADPAAELLVQVTVDQPVLVEPSLPDWLVCVDFGTSSTAIWVGRTSQAATRSIPLPLGEWLAQWDRNHDEFRLSKSEGREASFLLPSYIGVSPHLNLRADFDPLSLGDLALLEGDDSAARLARLGRSYDVSVPFPSRELMSQYSDAIVFALKRRMIEAEDSVLIGQKVPAVIDGVDRMVDRLELARLVPDCFAELGGHAAVQALHYAGAARGTEAVRLREAQKARMDANQRFGVVLTHPYGIDPSRAAIYRESGRRFLGAFLGLREAVNDPVVLVPEALAAAREGLEVLLREENVAPGQQTLVALDIGAGTYDATIVAAELGRDDVVDWRVDYHMGMTLGGSDLDRAITRRIIEILEVAARDPALARAIQIRADLAAEDHEVQLNADGPDRQRQLQFLQAVLVAKGRLTEVLLTRDEPYLWGEGTSLEIELGRAGDMNAVAVVAPDAPWIAEAFEFPIPGQHSAVAVGREADGTLVMKLKVAPQAFERPLAPRVADLVEVMGSEVPRVSLAALSALPAAARPVVVVTGRAALWPPLYAAIARTVAENPGAGARMLGVRPFTPARMKRAVLQGAVRLAAQTKLSLGAIRSHGLAAVGTVSPRGRDVDVRRLDVEAMPTGSMMVGPGRYQLVQMLPGLDIVDDRERVVRAFESVGLTPWVVIEDPLIEPADGQVELSWWRDEDGLVLRVAPPGRPPREIRPAEGGPFHGGG